MQQFIGGFVTAALLAAAGVGVYVFTMAPGAASSEEDDQMVACAGYCGEGTSCVEGACVVAPEPAPGEGKKKRRRRGRRGGRNAGAVDPEVAATGFVPVDDSGVPRFKPNADRTIELDAGSERLSDARVDAELAKLDGAFQGCIRTAAKYADDLGTGRVTIKFGLSGEGKVTGVNARAPDNLAKWGIVPCVRKAVYGHQFPKFDGPVMRVETSFSVD